MAEKKSSSTSLDHPAHNTFIAIVLIIVFIFLLILITAIQRNLDKETVERPAELSQEEVLKNLTAPQDNSSSYPDDRIIDRLTAQ